MSGTLVSDFKLKNNWAPRIGATFDPTGDGKGKVFGNFGIFYARVPNDLAARALSADAGIGADYFDANLTQPDAPLDVYRDIRAGVARRVKEVLVGADGPEVVAEIVLKAAQAARPKLHYAPGLASRMRLLRTFAPAGVLDAGVRKDLRLQG